VSTGSPQRGIRPAQQAGHQMPGLAANRSRIGTGGGGELDGRLPPRRAGSDAEVAAGEHDRAGTHTRSPTCSGGAKTRWTGGCMKMPSRMRGTILAMMFPAYFRTRWRPRGRRPRP
jgi:hypothetical protein